ncbi:MAG: PadR family transcriptional regulator [Bacillota bacterium]
MIRDFFLGTIKIHILYHAGKEPVYGSYLIEELEEHGHHVSPGTMYPTLNSLMEEGLLSREDQLVNGKIRKYYSLTPKGREVLEECKRQIRELANEVLED